VCVCACGGGAVIVNGCDVSVGVCAMGECGCDLSV
jgi:hypothetical protein